MTDPATPKDSSRDHVSPEGRIVSSALYRLPCGLHVIVDPERPFCRQCGGRLDLERRCRDCGGGSL